MYADQRAGADLHRAVPQEFVAALVERLRVLIVAGVLTGVVVGGLGSRLAMLVLRLSSPASVRGLTSDDGFTIGQITLGGSYNLLLLGATIGIIGAGAYRAVSPWLIGPRWFRRATVALACGAVVGSMLIHADGVDFVVLQPTWLAVGLFIALPALFGWCIGAAVDRVHPGSWTSRGRRRWLLPLVLVAAFPLTLLPLMVATLLSAVWVAVEQADLAMAEDRLDPGLDGGPAGDAGPGPPIVTGYTVSGPSTTGLGPALRSTVSVPRPIVVAVRGFWLCAAIAGLVALLRDIGALVS